MSPAGSVGKQPKVVWIKSSYSGGNGGECVEVAHAPAAMLVRDSKNPNGPRLIVTTDEWSAFIRHAAR